MLLPLLDRTSFVELEFTDRLLPSTVHEFTGLHAYTFFFSGRRRHTRCRSDWSSDVCSSDLYHPATRNDTSGAHDGIGRQPHPAALLGEHELRRRLLRKFRADGPVRAGK